MPMLVSDDLTVKAAAAFRIAARKVIDDARQAGTGIVVWRDNRVIEISCDEAEALLARAEADANSSQPGRAASH